MKIFTAGVRWLQRLRFYGRLSYLGSASELGEDGEDECFSRNNDEEPEKTSRKSMRRSIIPWPLYVNVAQNDVVSFMVRCSN